MNINEHVEADTVIGASTDITGDIRFTGRLHLDGTINGKLEAKDQDSVAVINGAAKGDIIAPAVIVGGSVDGDIHASQSLTLKSGGRVVGKVVCRSVDMALNATLDGKLTVDPKLIPRSASKTA